MILLSNDKKAFHSQKQSKVSIVPRKQSRKQTENYFAKETNKRKVAKEN